MWHDFMQMGAPAAFAILALCAVPVAILIGMNTTSRASRKLELDHLYKMRELDKQQKVIEHAKRAPDTDSF